MEQVRYLARGQQVVDEHQELLVRDERVRQQEHGAQVLEAAPQVDHGQVFLHTNLKLSAWIRPYLKLPKFVRRIAKPSLA